MSRVLIDMSDADPKCMIETISLSLVYRPGTVKVPGLDTSSPDPPSVIAGRSPSAEKLALTDFAAEQAASLRQME